MGASNEGDQSSRREAYSRIFRQVAEALFDWQSIDWEDGVLRWRFYRPLGQESPHQGWKVHVSGGVVESGALLSVVAGLLREVKAAFKVPRRIEDVVFLNSGDAGLHQAGKIVTIYPRDDAHAREVVTRIDKLWPVSSGPEVQTDLHLRPGSAVSLRYGVFGSGLTTVSSTGVYEAALILPDGTHAPDTRLLGGVQARHAPEPPLPCCPPAPHPVEPNATVWINSNQYLAMAVLSDTPRTRTVLAVNLGDLHTVVLKIGRPGVAENLRGRGIRDLLKKEYLTLSALQSQEGVAPTPLAWSNNGWPMLVMEDCRGESLSELPRSQRIKCLPHLARAVSRVHAAGFIHGDVKLENAVRRNGGVGLIDFELAEREGDATGAGGTRGYLAPEVALDSQAAASRDVFSLGGCLAQAFLDFPPALLPPGIQRLRALFLNEGAKRAAGLIERLAATDPSLRPAAGEAASMLDSNVDELAALSPTAGLPSTQADLDWCRRASSDAAQLVGQYACTRSGATWWRNTHFMRSFDCEGVNLGAAGILLGLATIDTAFNRSDFTDQINQGARWLASRAALGNAAGVFTGNAGVAIALAVTGCRLQNAAYVAAARTRFEAAATDFRESDLFSGSAGVVWAGCILSDVLKEDWPLQLTRPALDRLRLKTSQTEAIPAGTPAATSEASYFGCAHGSSGMAMALACWGRRTGDQTCIDAAREAFRRIASQGRTADGAALRMSAASQRQHALGNWCHGVAGYLWAMLQGLGDDPLLEAEINWAVQSMKNAMCVGTPTYCHGLAGQLELWHMLARIPRFHRLAEARAGKVVRALRILHHKVNGRCAWISDDPTVTTPDLWIGFLGPATALALHVSGCSSPLLSSEWLAACSMA